MFLSKGNVQDFVTKRLILDLLKGLCCRSSSANSYEMEVSLRRKLNKFCYIKLKKRTKMKMKDPHPLSIGTQYCSSKQVRNVYAKTVIRVHW